MFRLVVEKELKEMIGATKFAVAFGVCALLIILAFYLGGKNYQVARMQYEAAKAENLRQMEGQTDWLMVRDHRIFLPPDPLAALVTGVANDIGRTIDMQGSGELSAYDSTFNNEPVFAVFRFVDLDFIFQIVLSLFAILFAYDAINGEKERGTLRLTFANAMPRAHYILGKLVGAFLALAVPLLIPFLIGCLVLIALGTPLAGEDWARLGLMLFTGMLYFGTFLTLSVLISTLTVRSSSSFLSLLVVWICAVLIVPRTAVLLAGRAVAVPTIDEISSQKNRLNQQLWAEDRAKMSQFKPAASADPQKMMQEFNEFMSKIGEARTKKMNDFASRLNEDRRNKQVVQQRLAFGLARISPTAVLSLAITSLAATQLDLKDQFLSEATAYQKTYADFMREKTGMNIGGGGIVFRMHRDGEREEEKPIDPHELPEFHYHGKPARAAVAAALPDMGLLGLFNLIFFAGAFVAFMRYDLR